MNKLQIGVNVHAKIEHERKLKAKISAFNELLSYCGNWITIKDKSEFTADVCAYFKDQFQTEFAKTFNGKVPYSKRLEMFDIDLEKIKRLEKEFKSYNIELNLDTMQPIKDYDFNLYLTDEKQIERYKLGQKLIDTLNDFKEQGVELDLWQLPLGFKKFIMYHVPTKSLIPTIK